MARGRLEDRDRSALRVALYAGEVFPAGSLARLLKLLPAGTACWNLYGPTETNVCTFARVTEAPTEGAPSNIGRACPGVEVFAIGEGGEVVGPGSEGELVVAGGTVMQGYWGDPERTARSLVQHPAHHDFAQTAYRTGDLVRVAADGSFLFLGRRDHQVKVRGHRVELGEIESVLAREPAVAEAVAVAVPHEEQGAVLLAAVVLAPDAEANERDLRRACAARLPAYMVPERIAVRLTLPRTSSGKVDRLRLLEELTAVPREGGSRSGPPAERRWISSEESAST